MDLKKVVNIVPHPGDILEGILFVSNIDCNCCRVENLTQNIMAIFAPLIRNI